MFRSINQSMINRAIIRGPGVCRTINNDTVETIEVDCYKLQDDDANLYLYLNQLMPLVDMMKKNKLCNMMETVGIYTSMDVAGDSTQVATISCINNVHQSGGDDTIAFFNWNLFIHRFTGLMDNTAFTNAFNFSFGEGDGYKAYILGKPAKFIDDSTDLTDARMATIRLIFN